MGVIVTRPQLEAVDWVERLRAAGVDATALPLISIAAPPDLDAVRAAGQALGACHAVMFVSANAVRHFFAQADGTAFQARAWAPGPGTAAALRSEGVPAERIDQPRPDAPQFDSEALWEVVAPQARPGGCVLVVRGGDARGRSAGRDWLAEQLAARGVQVDRIVAYVRGLPQWNDAQRQLACAAAADGSTWLFSSSEAVGHLRALLPAAVWSRARALATHPRIAQAARQAGFGQVRECRPGFDEVVASLQSPG